MKNTLLILTALIFLGLNTSCKKSDVTPGSYKNTTPTQDTSRWQSGYNNGGTIPTSTTSTSNELVGTTWVLTKIVSGFATTNPNDTIRFIDNTRYTINGGAVKNYNLTTSVASTNKTLSLYYFYPFGGSHYSGEVSGSFVVDGVVNMCEFMNIQNTTDKIKAWFIKL